MAIIIKFDIEQEHRDRNWRELIKGDNVWHVPNPDPDGNVDTGDITLWEFSHLFEGQAVVVGRPNSGYVMLPLTNVFLAEARPAKTGKHL